MRLLRSCRWPGSVRELFSVIESAAIRGGSDRIEAAGNSVGLHTTDGEAHLVRETRSRLDSS